MRDHSLANPSTPGASELRRGETSVASVDVDPQSAIQHSGLEGEYCDALQVIEERLDAELDSLVELLAVEERSAKSVVHLDTSVLETSESQNVCQQPSAIGNLETIVELLADGSRSEHRSALERGKVVEFISGPTRSFSLVDLSVVIPCCNAEMSIGECVLKAQYAIEKLQIAGEVIVADYGSSDDSTALARELGATVLECSKKNYGSAVKAGVEKSNGRYVVVADADDRYDLTQITRFYKSLDDGADVVQGCRDNRGGGVVEPGAMTLAHRVANCGLSWMVQKMFRSPVRDVYCGLRGFTREAYERLGPQSVGRECGPEMIVKGTLFGSKIEELAISYNTTSHTAGRSRLQSLADGWRAMKFFLLLSPRWTFLMPAAVLAAVSALACVGSYNALEVAGFELGAATFVTSAVFLLVAFQLAFCAILAKEFAGYQNLLPADQRLDRLGRWLSPELSVALSAALIAGGFAMLLQNSNFSSLQGESTNLETLHWLIPGVATIAIGIQAAFGRILLSLLRMNRG